MKEWFHTVIIVITGGTLIGIAARVAFNYLKPPAQEVQLVEQRPITPSYCPPNFVVSNGKIVAMFPGVCHSDVVIAGNYFYIQPPATLPFWPPTPSEQWDRLQPPRLDEEL